MSKKRLYLIIAITAIITVGFFLAAYIISQQGNSTAEAPSKNPFANFFPFGKSTGDSVRGPSGDTPSKTGTGDVNNDENNSLAAQNGNLPPLRQISMTPAAGYFPSTLSGKTAVRFVERSTGNIFETVMETMRKDRISNALIPGIREGFFGNVGKSLVYRYLKEGSSSIVTFVRTVPNPNRSKAVEPQGATTTNPIEGSYLENDIINVLVSSDAKNMFYLTKSSDFNTRQATGNVFNFEKNTSTRVFQSPFAEWLPVYFDGKTAVLQTKASQNVPGYLYALAGGELKKIIGGINGLTALPSPDLQKVLYSKSNRGGVTLHLYNRKDGKTIDLPLITLPEKCAWNADSFFIYCAAPDYIPTAEYPDDWYKGNVSFNDTVWRIDSATGNTTNVFSPKTFGAGKMDMENLVISHSKDFLFFINKTDSTLWGYDLTY